MDSGQTEYAFLWLIENYSYFIPRLTLELDSPEFAPQELGGSSWTLHLNPICLKWKNSPCESLFLERISDNSGPNDFPLKFEISIITADGSTLYSEECEHEFSQEESYRAFEAYVDMDELYVRRNTDFLPGDTLGVLCRMWKGERTARTVTQWTARTRIGVKEISFIHRVEKFSALKPEERETIQVPYQSKKGFAFSSSVFLSNVGETVKVVIKPSEWKYQILKMKLSLIDVFGNIVEIGEVDYRFDNYEEDLDKLERRFTKQFLLDKRKEYLPNDKLSLLCDCTFTTGVACDVIEENLLEIPMAEYNRRYHNSYSKNDRNTAENMSSHAGASEDTKVQQNDERLANEKIKSNTFCNSNAPSTSSFMALGQKTNNDPHQGECSRKDKLSTLPSVQEDLETLYHNQLLTDAALKTTTKSFPAHKTVLCVRSSVFCAMLTSDVKERNSDCILRVDDLDDETVRRLLLFLYSDRLEELQWDSAMKLYCAGDKYAI